MTNRSPASSYLRRRSLRGGLISAATFASIPVIAILGLLVVAALVPSSNATPAHVIGEVGRWLVAGVGHEALGDAPWALTPFFAVLVGVYASDYGPRRRLGRLNVDEVELSPEERKVIVALSVIGVLMAAYAADYALLVIVTVVVEGAGYGHLVGILPACALVFVLGASINVFDTPQPRRLRFFNAVGRRRVAVDLDRLAPFVPRGLTVRRASWTIVLWVGIPLVGFAVAASAAAMTPSSTVLACAAIALGAGLLEVITIAYVAWTLRSARMSAGFSGIAVRVLAGCVGSVSALAVTGTVLLVLARHPHWLGVVLSVDLALGALEGFAWFAPRPLHALRGRAWRWTPGLAILAIQYRGLTRWRRSLRVERSRIETYMRELSLAAAAR